MLHEIGVELAQHFNFKGCPFLVLDGGDPQARPTNTFARERVIIEHDPAGDSFTPRHRADVNPRTRMTRNIGCKISIFAQNPSKGSTYWEHVRRAEHVLDMVLIAIDKIAKVRGNIVSFKSGKVVDSKDLESSDTKGGAVYELFFSFDRGVADRNWNFSAGPTAVVSPQMVGGQAVTFNASEHTITRVAGSFIDDQFASGMVVLVSGSTLNNGTLTAITSVTDLTLTFASGLVNEGPVTGVTITGNGVLIQNTTVSQGADGTETI